MPLLNFEGQAISFKEGDSIASALYRAGVRIFSRSFKYHRPRGLYCLTGDCPNCLVSVNGEPSTRSCCTPAEPGQQVRRENAWPSADFDVLAASWFMRRFMPVGWYYKTMTRPSWIWRVAEPLLRRMAGLARVPTDLPVKDRIATHEHVDLFVAGGGVAGLAAALAGGQAGQRVLLAEEGTFGEKIPPGATRSEIDRLLSELRRMPQVTLLERAPAVGIYEGPLVAVAARDQLHLVHPQRIVVATGAVEEHAVFPGNDLPGVWLGRGAARMAAVHGIRPGKVAVFCGSTAESPQHVAALAGAGVKLAAVVVPAELVDLIPAGSRVIPDGELVEAVGRRRLRSVVIETANGRETLRCDALVVAQGLQPRNGLLREAVTEPVIGAGEVVAPGCSVQDAMESGRKAARAKIAAPTELFISNQEGPEVGKTNPAVVVLPGQSSADRLPVACGKGFVCLCEDVQTKEFEAAWEEGFRSTELLKRYTTATMGPCQGAMCHGHMRAFVAARTPQPHVSRSTTARPPARPIRVEDAAAGRHFTVEHRTALHRRHLDLGGKMGWFGAWKRTLNYGDRRGEYDAVRRGVSIMDVGTLGKFLITGPDATQFLERLYPCRIDGIAAGRLRYTVSLNEAGYIFDDGLVCRIGSDSYYVTFTTAGAEQGEAWLKDWAETWSLRVHIVNRTAALGAINVAGPLARELLARVCKEPLTAGEFPFASHREISVAGVPCRALRLGFVGELSFELHHPGRQSVRLWDELLAAGEDLGIRPHGVDALLQLRLEKGHIVIGMDTDFDSTPAKVGLSWVVKMEKEAFIGKTALQRLGNIALDKKLVGVTFEGTTAPIVGTALSHDGTYAGYLTSSGYSPVLDRCVALAWLGRRDGVFPQRVNADGRIGTVSRLPFYDPDGVRIRG